MRHFVLFLETVALRRWGQSIDEKLNVSPPPDVSAEQLPDRGDQVAVWNTLLELYLTSTQQADDSEGGSQITGRQKEKVMKLLRNPTLPYDTTHALILCSTNGYTPGLVLLWEKMGMYEDVLRFWMDQANDSNSTPTASAEASSEVIKHLELYGPEHPDLYPLVLRFLTSSGELLSRHTKDVKSILSVIEQEEIMPPLAVVQVLSRNSVPSVGLIKEWLVERIKNSRQEIHDVSQNHYFAVAEAMFILFAGPTTHRFIPVRDSKQSQKGRRVIRSRAPTHIPCHPMFKVRRSTRSPQHSFHVQPQLSSEVRRFDSLQNLDLSSYNLAHIKVSA